LRLPKGNQQIVLKTNKIAKEKVGELKGLKLAKVVL